MAGLIPGDLDVLGSTALLTSASWTAHLIDVSNPASPAEISQFRIAGGFANAAFDLTGNFAYVAAYESSSETTVFEVLQVSDAANPTRLAQLKFPGFPARKSLQIGSGFVLLATSDAVESTAWWIDMRNPAEPVAQEVAKTAGSGTSIALANRRLYLGFWSHGLKVFSVRPEVKVVEMRKGEGTKLLLDGDVHFPLHVEYTSALGQPSQWSTLVKTNATTLPMILADPDTAGSAKFYRALQP
ncbi:MAG: hypothetical protein AB1813_18675 [Verrucomicrobiota bacterium]